MCNGDEDSLSSVILLPQRSSTCRMEQLDRFGNVHRALPLKYDSLSPSPFLLISASSSPSMHITGLPSIESGCTRRTALATLRAGGRHSLMLRQMQDEWCFACASSPAQQELHENNTPPPFGEFLMGAHKRGLKPQILRGTFGAQKAPESTQKDSKPGAQKHSKSTPWGTFRPGPLNAGSQPKFSEKIGKAFS